MVVEYFMQFFINVSDRQAVKSTKRQNLFRLTNRPLDQRAWSDSWLSDQRVVEPTESRTNGNVRRTNGPSDYWAIGLQGRRTNGRSDHRSSDQWAVETKVRRNKETPPSRYGSQLNCVMPGKERVTKCCTLSFV